jgi:hypothetical protein
MFYTSDDLMALRSELAGHNVDSNRVAVRYNPWDLGEVWVLSPVDGTYLKTSAIDSAMKGMTEYQRRVLKRAIREQFDQPDHLLNLAAGRNAIRDVIEAAMQKPSGKRRVRVARFLQSAPALTDELEETGSTFPQDALPADTNVPSTAPSIPESSEDSSSEACDPSDVNVDDWEIASPDL